jgi:carbonic anhydrase/acetyltransferase-like protein (isoleucine patch superfamily)
MPIYALGDDCPEIDESAWVHPEAVVIGAVTVGPESSIWPGAVLRGDGLGIVIGARTSIQDGSVLHCTEALRTEVGDDCLVGHLVHLEGCRIESRAFVGTGSIVLHRCVVGADAVVAAGAVVLDGTDVPPGALAVGVPANIRLGAAPPIREHGVQHYVHELARYRRDLKRID